MTESYYYGNMIASVKTYGKVIRELKSLLEHDSGHPVTVQGQFPRDRFKDVMRQLEVALSSKSGQERISKELDLDLALSAEDVAQKLIRAAGDDSRISDMDDLTPNQIKPAIRETANEMGASGEAVDVDMTYFLRESLRRVFADAGLKGRLNVGTNRHFPRLYQWLKECADDTDWEDGRGLWIKNAGGHGPVAAEPTDPHTLKITINRDFL